MIWRLGARRAPIEAIPPSSQPTSRPRAPPLALRGRERLEQLGALDGGQAGVVQLVDVDVVHAEAAQALFAGPADEGGGEVLRQLLVAGAGLAAALRRA